MDKIKFLCQDTAKSVSSNDFVYYETTSEEIFITKYEGKKETFVDLEKAFPNKKVMGLSSNCFSGSLITGINIPDSVYKIGTGAFRDCKKLVSIKLPDSLEALEESTFDGCSNLINVEFNLGLKEIRAACFYNCPLLSINVKPGLEIIKTHAFFICRNLSFIHLPNSLKTIEEEAFLAVFNSPTIVEFDGSLEEWESIDNQEETLDVSKIRFDNRGSITLKRSNDYEWAEYEDGSVCLIKCFNKDIQNLDFTSSFSEATSIEIGPRCFDGNDNCLLNKIDSRITRFEEEAIYGGSVGYVRNFVLPKNVQYIGKNAIPYGNIFCEQPEKPESWGEQQSDVTLFWYSETSNTDGQHWRYVDGKPTIWTK